MSLGLRHAIERFRQSSQTMDSITAWRDLPSCPAHFAPLPMRLSGALRGALKQVGIGELYRHQADAIAATERGEHVAVATPTASGKSLCYVIPVLESILQDDATCALGLFPTKALAHDQLSSFRRLAGLAGLRDCVFAYDGDTPVSRRRRVRDRARVVVTNPDMLHVSMLPNHTKWDRFFRQLRYVIIDEMHSYRGVFGSHVANVLRRLRRVCAFYGSSPQYICTSATIANPSELAEALVGHTVHVIGRNGSPQGTRTVMLINPPVIDRRLGLRVPLLDQVQRLSTELLRDDVQTVIFCQSRRSVERLVIRLRQDAIQDGRDPKQIRGYRGGYLAEERREIERDLRAGIVRGIVATNALELGIDIGGLDACLMAGYPGTIAATWQRAGRAGRGTNLALAIMVASDAPSDQYIVNHPEYLFGQPVERALVHPDNLYLLLSHLRCAAAELPVVVGEAFGDEDTETLLTFLRDQGEVRRARDRWLWSGTASPASEISLRGASPDHVTIMAQTGNGPSDILGTIDRDAAPLWVHEGAVYLHEGTQYTITSLDWPAGIAVAERHNVAYFTEASQNRRIHIVQTLASGKSQTVALARGDIRLTRSVKRYRRIDLRTHAEIGWGTIDIPDQESYNQACWFMVPDAVVTTLEEQGLWAGQRRYSRGPNWAEQRNLARKRDNYRCRTCGATEPDRRQHEVHHIVPFGKFGWRPGLNENYRQANALDNLITLCPACHRQAERQVAVQSSLAGLSRVMGHVIPLLFMCDRHDIGLHADVRRADTKLPTIFCYDTVPGGVGLCDQIIGSVKAILEHAIRLVDGCPCESGCPSCIGATSTPNSFAKAQVVHLARTMLHDVPAVRQLDVSFT